MFQKNSIRVSEGFMRKNGLSLIFVDFFLSQVSKKFVRNPCVSKNSAIEKFNA